VAVSDSVIRVGDSLFACEITWTLPTNIQDRPSKAAMKQEARRNGKSFKDDVAAFRLQVGQVGTSNRRKGHLPNMIVAADKAATWIARKNTTPAKTLMVMPMDPDSRRYWLVGVSHDGLIMPATDKIIVENALLAALRQSDSSYSIIYMPDELQFPGIDTDDPRRRTAPALSDVLTIEKAGATSLEPLGTARQGFFAFLALVVLIVITWIAWSTLNQHRQDEARRAQQAAAIAIARKAAQNTPPPWTNVPTAEAGLALCWQLISLLAPSVLGWNPDTIDCDINSQANPNAVLATGEYHRQKDGTAEVLTAIFAQRKLGIPHLDFTAKTATTKLFAPIPAQTARLGAPPPLAGAAAATLISKTDRWPDTTIEITSPPPPPPPPPGVPKDETGAPILPKVYPTTRFKITTTADPIMFIASKPPANLSISAIRYNPPHSWRYEGVIFDAPQ
jgi:hypothetical protein